MRINTETRFLQSFVTAQKRNNILHKASEEQIKALVECVVNYKLFRFQDKERKITQQAKALKVYFSKKRQPSIQMIRKFLIKHNKILSKLIRLVLLKFAQEAFVCVLTS
jgi:predicted nucleotide-binding protein (sugar kinase/HSP70/actin superfamily)